MKKNLLALLFVLNLAMASCSQQNTVSETESYSSSGSSASQETEQWPENEYTNGLPVCPGTVSRTLTDTEKGYCSISLTDISDDVYRAYMEQLTKSGFSLLQENTEEIEGQNYTSFAKLLSDGEKWISISHIPDHLTLYISFNE